MIANLVPVVVLAAVLIGYFVYMKCFYPRFRQRCEAAADRAEAVWRERGEAIVGEYLRDPDRFGKIAEVLGETPVRGLISTSAPKQGLGERIGKGIVGAVTFTRETDLGHYYFVAADDGLHLLGFDGERCFLNEVYAAGEIRRARLEPRTFSFDYKGGTVRMEVPNGGLAEGYPRFRIHEYDKVPTSSDQLFRPRILRLRADRQPRLQAGAGRRAPVHGTERLGGAVDRPEGPHGAARGIQAATGHRLTRSRRMRGPRAGG